MNRNPFGFQSQLFSGIVSDAERAQPVVVKLIDPDSDICREIKRVSPQTKVIVRIYTGQPEVDDAVQHPDAYAYGVEYAERVWVRVKDPANVDFFEDENEANDHYNDLTRFIQRKNDFTIGFCDRAKVLGFKPCVLNFSTGYPEVYHAGGFELWANAWRGLKPCLDVAHAMGGVMGLHEYDAPDLLRLWSDTAQRGYLVGRHKAIYTALDNHPIGLYMTEFGVDWLVHGIAGGFWHDRGEDAPLWYMGQLREAYHRVLSSTPQLRGICLFLHGGYHPLWEEYDTARTDTARETFINFMREDLGWRAGVTPQPPPVTGDTMITPLEITDAIPFLVKQALKRDFGQSIYGERTVNAADGKRYHLWVFEGGGVGTEEGKYSDADVFTFDPVTGAINPPAAPPPVVTPPPSTLPPYVFPDILRQAGFVGVEGVPILVRPFYRLTPAANVALGVSAFCEVVCIGANGIPRPGAQVVSRRADGKGEVIRTGGDGKARFNFGSGSAFTPPAQPPFEIFIAEGAVKDEDTKLVSWAARLSDTVFCGDPHGQHAETYLQFVGYG